jgi:PAS domain-containing protein
MSEVNSESVIAGCRPARNETSSPIFILGIAPRSGTNYLHDLIRVHPECDSESSVLEEDFLLANAHFLLKYAERVSRSWKKRWGDEELQREKRLLCTRIGDGLIAFLRDELERRKELAGRPSSPRPRRLVTKTPHVTNLEFFFSLFPSAPLLILVRDGRSVVESAVRTFHKPFGYAVREWATSAAEILAFQRRHPQANYLIIRYEELYQNVEGELRRIFSFLRLDPDAYDYQAARNLPVRGSCAIRSETANSDPWVTRGIDWNPAPKPADFDPLTRWSSWNRPRHERFNWIGASSMAALGYRPERYRGFGWFWFAWNAGCDLLHGDQLLWLLLRFSRRISAVHTRAQFFDVLKDARTKIRETILFSPPQKTV